MVFGQESYGKLLAGKELMSCKQCTEKKGTGWDKG
jgi:hypothetical protein